MTSRVFLGRRKKSNPDKAKPSVRRVWKATGTVFQVQGSDGDTAAGTHKGFTTAGTQTGEGDGRIRAGRQDVSGIIRAAIEKVKNYPPLARRRGIEGTATAEFAINSRGVPENIRTLKSSP